MAAVREPSEPSMKPFNIPVCSMGSFMVVVGAHGLQFVERCIEGQPLRDAQVELALFFHLLEDQKILPVAEVLHAGDAVREGVGDGQLVAAAALVVAGRRNDLCRPESCADSRRMPVGSPLASRSMAPP